MSFRSQIHEGVFFSPAEFNFRCQRYHKMRANLDSVLKLYINCASGNERVQTERGKGGKKCFKESLKMLFKYQCHLSSVFGIKYIPLLSPEV